MGLESNSAWMEERTQNQASHFYQNAFMGDVSQWGAPSCNQQAYNGPVSRATESLTTRTWNTASQGTKTVGVCRPITRSEPIVTNNQDSLRQPLIVNLPPLTTACSVIYDVPRACCSSPTYKEQVSQYSQLSQLTQEDIQTLLTTYKHLDQCLFYYPHLSMMEAKKKLSAYKPGSFLLRTSSDPNFKFSLSVKTPRGTTSIRIAFRKGKFCLDSDPGLLSELPSFASVFELVDYYMQLAGTFRKNNVVFLEATGRKDTPIVLKKPCLSEPGSLKHLSRLAIHTALRSKPQKLHGLPGASTSIIDYLMDYPYPV